MSIVDWIENTIAPISKPYEDPVDAFLRQNPSLTRDEAMDRLYGTHRTGGGGGGSGPDHFAEVSGDTAATLAAKAKQDEWENQFNEAQFNWKKAQDDRNYALSIGDQQLAKQKQSDANYWQGIANQLQVAQMGLTARGQDMDYQASMARIQADKYDSDQRFQVGMAGAKNDEERNKIQAAWNAEQAAIAKMEDETKRVLGGQQNQTSQFQAETDRAASMGRLALDNNKFIADEASNPHNLWGMYFMQRGVAPDWNTMAAGGTPAQGQALVPRDPFSVFTPTTAAPVFNGTPGNTSAGAVGQATQYRPDSNPFIGTSTAAASGGGAAPAFTPTAWTAPSIPTGGPPELRQDTNAGGLAGGVPIANLKPGMNLSTVGSDTKGSDFTYGKSYYDEAKTRPIGADDVVGKGTQVWTDVPAAASGGVFMGSAVVGDSVSGKKTGHEEIATPVNTPYGAGLHVQPINQSGMAAQRNAMNRRRPVNQMYRYAADFGPRAAGMSKSFAATSRMAADFGMKAPPPPQPIQSPAKVQLAVNSDADTAYWRNQRVNPPIPQPAPQPQPQYQPPQQFTNFGGGIQLAQPQPQPQPLQFTNFGGGVQLAPQPVQPFYGADFGMVSRPAQPVNYGADQRLFDLRNLDFGNAAFAAARNAAPAVTYSNPNGAQLASLANRGQLPRFAIGTDASAAYQNAGMGYAWIPNSNNAGLSGMDLPTRLKMMTDAGMPVSPAVASAVSGRVAPTLNTAAAVGGVGGGSLPSLQALGGMSKSELENLKGYYDGPVSMPWADVVDFIGKPTSHLQTAAVARGV